MKHKIISYAFLLPLLAVFVSCLPEGSSTLSYTGAWGTVEYDDKSGEIYVWADAGAPLSNSVFADAVPGNRVLIDFAIDMSKYKTLPGGMSCYLATVSNYEEVPVERNIVALADTANADPYGKHPFDDVSLYNYIVQNCNKRQVLSLSAQYTGADDTYPMTMIQRFESKQKESISGVDTVKFEIRCDNGTKTGTRPYLRYRAFDITPYLEGTDKAVIQLKYTVKLSSGTQSITSSIGWIRPKEEEK